MKQGIFLAFTTAVISGVAIFYNKVFLLSGIDPLVFNILKNGGVAIILLGILFSTGTINSLRKYSRTTLLQLLSIGIIGGGIPFYLFFTGLQQISAIQANFIHKTLFLWVAILAVPFLKEKLSWKLLLTYSIIAAITLFTNGLPKFTFSQGELFILGATLLWSIEQIIAKKTLTHVPAKAVAFFRMFIGTCVLLFIFPFTKDISALIIPQQMILPVIGSIILLSAYVLTWYHALAKAPASIVSSILILATPVTTLLSVGLLNQPLSLTQYIFIAVLCTSLYIHTRNYKTTPSKYV